MIIWVTDSMGRTLSLKANSLQPNEPYYGLRDHLRRTWFHFGKGPAPHTNMKAGNEGGITQAKEKNKKIRPNGQEKGVLDEQVVN